MAQLFESNNEISNKVSSAVVTFSIKTEVRPFSHTRLDFNLLVSSNLVSSNSLLELDLFSTAKEKFFQGAFTFNFQIGAIAFFQVLNGIFMNVRLNSLAKRDLLSFVVQGNSVGIIGSEEILKDLERITIKLVTTLASYTKTNEPYYNSNNKLTSSRNTILKNLFSITIVNLSQLS